MNKKQYVSALFLLLIYIATVFMFFVNDPPIWPDEAWYADIAYNFLKTGVMGSPMLGGILDSDKLPTLYPPLLFYLYAGGYALFGLNEYVQRIFAFIAGGFFLVTIYSMGKKVYKLTDLVLVFLILLFLSNPYFMRATHFGRPEVYIMLLHSIAYYLVLRGKSIVKYALAGTLVGASFLLQSYGIIAGVVIGIYIFWSHWWSKKMIYSGAIFVLPICILSLLWLFVLDFRTDLLFQAISIHSVRKSLESDFLKQMRIFDPKYAYLIFFYVVVSVIGAAYCIYKRTHATILLGIGLLVTWFFVLIGRQFWYGVYPLLFVYLLLAHVLQEALSSNRKIMSTIGIVAFTIVLVILNIGYYSNSIIRYPYRQYANAVAKNIPNNSTVLLSAIPDPYFALRENKTLTITQFIGLPGFKKEYQTLLDNADYVVYTATYDTVYGTFLNAYLKENTASVVFVDSGVQQQSGMIIQLKPKKERVHVN